MTLNPTGEQYSISHGRYEAVVTEVGATLRSVCVEGRELLWTFDVDTAPVKYQGQHLLPWPNRIRDGRYTFECLQYQVPISEVPRQVALHGLNSGFAWKLIQHTDTLVEQRHTFYPEEGWPGTLTATITHQVSDDGLRVSVSVTNDGSVTLPYGYATHPYFRFDNIDEVTLELPFASELQVDPERLLPIALTATSAMRDFQSPRVLGDALFDTAFTSANEPHWSVRISEATRSIEVWADQSLPWVQVFTRPGRDAIAVEPMTCGPDAFNEGPTHDALIVLTPGESHCAIWGVRAV